MEIFVMKQTPPRPNVKVSDYNLDNSQKTTDGHDTQYLADLSKLNSQETGLWYKLKCIFCDKKQIDFYKRTKAELEYKNIQYINEIKSAFLKKRQRS